MYSLEIARQLRHLGHDVISVKERPELLGARDEALITLMVSEDRVIVTDDAAHFIPLVGQRAADGYEHGGVILTSDRSLPRSRATIGRFVEILDALLSGATLESLRNQVRWLA